MRTIRRELVRLSMRDKELDHDERAVIDRFDRLHERTTDITNRRKLIALIDKGADPSAYMDEIAASLHWKVVSLEDERAQRTVVPFRPRNNDTAS